MTRREKIQQIVREELTWPPIITLDQRITDRILELDQQEERANGKDDDHRSAG
jgi:hypothetical protein